MLQSAAAPKDTGLKDNQKCIWVVKDGNMAPTVVTTGVSNGLKTEILSGIDNNAVVAMGYSENATNSGQQGGEKSPFAPQPPGRNKKK